MRKSTVLGSALVCAVLLLAGCGGGSSGSSLLSGTAAAGAPLADCTVTVKDANGTTVTGTTDAEGKFTITLPDGLVLPLVLRVDDGAGGYLYSTVAVAGTATANIHPYTDLTVRTYYEAEGLDTDTTFDTLSSGDPVPSTDEAGAIKAVVSGFLALALSEQGLDPETFDVVSTPFTADGAGFDEVLDNSTFTDVGDTEVDIVLGGGSVAQTTTVAVDAGTDEMTAATVVTDGVSTSTSFDNATTVMAGAGLEGAVAGVNAMLNEFRTVVNTQGAALADEHLVPFHAAGFFDSGMDTAFYTAYNAWFMRGNTISSFAVDRVLTYDDVTPLISVIVKGSSTVAGDFSAEYTLTKPGADWLFYGNQKDFYVLAWAYMDRTYWSSGMTDEKIVNISVRYYQDVMTAAPTVTGGGIYTDTVLDQYMERLVHIQADPLPAATLDVTEYQYGLRDVLAGDYPPAGTAFDVTIPLAAGSDIVTVYTNTTTDETSVLSGLSGYGLGDFNLGGTLSVNWTLPTTFAVGYISAGVAVFNGDGWSGDRDNVNCNEGAILVPTATSATFSIPTLVNGQPVLSGWVHVDIHGINGHQTTVGWRFD